LIAEGDLERLPIVGDSFAHIAEEVLQADRASLLGGDVLNKVSVCHQRGLKARIVTISSSESKNAGEHVRRQLFEVLRRDPRLFSVLRGEKR